MDSLENVVDIPIAFNKYREESRRKKFFPPEKKRQRGISRNNFPIKLRTRARHEIEVRIKRS